MFTNPSASWHYSNQADTNSPCEHCGGMVFHERWCITRDPLVQYAYAVVLDPERLAFADRLILHALGASWVENRRAESPQPV